MSEKPLIEEANHMITRHLRDIEAQERLDDRYYNTSWQDGGPDPTEKIPMMQLLRHKLRKATKQRDLKKVQEIIENPSLDHTDKILLAQSWEDFQHNEPENDFEEVIIRDELRDPIHIAASNGDHEIVKYLLDNVVAIKREGPTDLTLDKIVDSVTDGEFLTPLGFAVIRGMMAEGEKEREQYLETIYELLERGAIVNNIIVPGDIEPHITEIVRDAPDRDEEIYRNTIYHMINNAHQEQMPVVFPIPEDPSDREGMFGETPEGPGSGKSKKKKKVGKCPKTNKKKHRKTGTHSHTNRKGKKKRKNSNKTKRKHRKKK